MKRRSYLSTLAGSTGLVGGVALAGCSAGYRPESGLRAGDATVERGETAPVPIEAAAALHLRVADRPGAADPGGTAPVEFLFGEADLDPDPKIIWDVKPPVWRWETARRVSIRLPVRAAADAPPGGYDFRVHASDGETELTATGRLTVE